MNETNHLEQVKTCKQWAIEFDGKPSIHFDADGYLAAKSVANEMLAESGDAVVWLHAFGVDGLWMQAIRA